VTAAELIERVKGSGGRVYRTVEPGRVFVITGSPRLAEKLQALGARSHGQSVEETSPPGGYWRDGRSRQLLEWDLDIGSIPVDDEVEVGQPALWAAAG